MGKSIHISLPDDVKATLKLFAAKRSLTMTAIIIDALKKLFACEGVDPRKHEALQRVLERKLSVSKPFVPESLFVTLYMNASNAPDASARTWWGVAVYLSGIDKTNKQLFTEIQDELTRELQG